jgi:hypothetical protein
MGTMKYFMDKIGDDEAFPRYSGADSSSSSRRSNTTCASTKII